MMNSPSLRLAYRAVPLLAWLPIMRCGESRPACTDNIHKIYDTFASLQIDQGTFQLAKTEKMPVAHVDAIGWLPVTKILRWRMGYIGLFAALCTLRKEPQIAIDSRLFLFSTPCSISASRSSGRSHRLDLIGTEGIAVNADIVDQAVPEAPGLFRILAYVNFIIVGFDRAYDIY